MSHKENQIPFLYRRDILDNNQCLEIVKEFWKNKNLHKNVNTSNKVSTDLQCKFSEKNTRILLSKSINYISDALTIAINDYTKLYPQTKKLYLDWGLYDNFNLQFYQSPYTIWSLENIFYVQIIKSCYKNKKVNTVKESA